MTRTVHTKNLHHADHRSVFDRVGSEISKIAHHLPHWSLTVLHWIAVLVALAIVLFALRQWLRRRAEKQPGQTYELIPPDSSQWEPSAWVTFYRALYGISAPWWKRLTAGQPWIALEYVATSGRVVARCWFPARLEAMLRAQLTTVLPGLDLRKVTDQPSLTQGAARSRLHLWREALYPVGQPKTDPLRSILAALSVAQSGLIQIVIRPDVDWQGRALKRLNQLAGFNGSQGLISSIAWELFDIIFGGLFGRSTGSPGATTTRLTTQPDPPSAKADQPGYQVEVRLRVGSTSSAAAKEVMHSVVSAFRALDGANGLRPTRVWRGQRFDIDLVSRRPPRTKGLTLIPEEVAHLFHLPCTGTPMDVAPVRLAPTRLPIVQGKKVICLAEDGNETPVTISPTDARQHIHILGPTGSGKSTLLLNLALDDIEAGHGVAVIDPKGDLVRSLLERIPAGEADRVILIDPSYREQPVGLNVMECDDPDLHEVVCDGIVTIFKKTYERFWGPRTDDILRAAVLTLLRHPDTTLCEVPLLLLQPEARKEFTAGLRDPVGLEPFWVEYEQTPASQRLQMVGPLLNKLRSVLLRRTVRNMLGQSVSTVRIPEAIDHRAIVLVSLAKGLLGEDTSRLLGAFLVARIWQAAQARANRPEAWRPDFTLYLDEFQNYLHLPQSLDEVLVEARGYHLGLALANQHLAQLGPTTRQALAGNARTRVVFQCGQEDARYLAREFEPQLGERDLRQLQRFQVALRLCVNGQTVPPFTGVTRPETPSLGTEHADWLAGAALARVGRPRVVVETEIAERLRAKGFGAEEQGPAA